MFIAIITLCLFSDIFYVFLLQMIVKYLKQYNCNLSNPSIKKR